MGWDGRMESPRDLENKQNSDTNQKSAERRGVLGNQRYYGTMGMYLTPQKQQISQQCGALMYTFPLLSLKKEGIVYPVSKPGGKNPSIVGEVYLVQLGVYVIHATVSSVKPSRTQAASVSPGAGLAHINMGWVTVALVVLLFADTPTLSLVMVRVGGATASCPRRVTMTTGMGTHKDGTNGLHIVGSPQKGGSRSRKVSISKAMTNFI
ncbi:hypothetical protein DFH27DRAFT_529335 [Peziza echinospora]|nr:hypothetical protein DFH27DRAFT_529335 [Peziza echinospora]